MTSRSINILKNIAIYELFRYNISGDFMQRYFADKKINDKFILLDSDLRHIKKVMRMKPLDEIIVVYDNKSYLCYLNDEYEIILKETLNEQIDNLPEISLIVPILKEQKLDYILQKSTELGVSKIILYYSERGIVKENEKGIKKLERWKMILKEASEQSHRNTIPKIEIMNLNEIIKLEGINIVCSTIEKSRTIKNVLKTSSKYDRINLVIGPEGGLTENEENKLLENNFIPVTLGNRILRVETVPLFIMSIVNYECME